MQMIVTIFFIVYCSFFIQSNVIASKKASILRADMRALCFDCNIVTEFKFLRCPLWEEKCSMKTVTQVYRGQSDLKMPVIKNVEFDTIHYNVCFLPHGYEVNNVKDCYNKWKEILDGVQDRRLLSSNNQTASIISRNLSPNGRVALGRFIGHLIRLIAKAARGVGRSPIAKAIVRNKNIFNKFRRAVDTFDALAVGFTIAEYKKAMDKIEKEKKEMEKFEKIISDYINDWVGFDFSTADDIECDGQKDTSHVSKYAKLRIICTE